MSSTETLTAISLARVILCVVLPTLIAGAIALTVILIIRRRKRQNRNQESRTESAVIKKSLGEVLKTHRTACKMTQEFVAERMGVSRQTVSKWETGINEPSTSNLLQLAKLFGVPAEKLLNEIDF